jgi:ABC-type multidrug transport system fused ATPase/permease subunit
MPLLDLFWAMLWFFLWIAWIWLLIVILMDVFRSDDMGGWGKALWTLFIIFVPFLGVLIYLIARGKGMSERSVQEAVAREKQTQEYIRSVSAVSATSSADELEKLARLRSNGTISEEEFQAAKAKVLTQA